MRGCKECFANGRNSSDQFTFERHPSQMFHTKENTEDFKCFLHLFIYVIWTPSLSLTHTQWGGVPFSFANLVLEAEEADLGDLCQWVKV